MKSIKIIIGATFFLPSLYRKHSSTHSQLYRLSNFTAFMISLCFAITFIVTTPAQCFSQQKVMTAHSILAQVPPTIFDNTFLPISESEKMRILDANAGKNWIIIHDSPDFLYLMPKESEFAHVEVRMFRGIKGGVAVLGARTNDSCATEMWQFTKKGGIIPYFIENEPMPADYLPNGITLAQDISTSFPLCFEGDKLEAKAMFWDTNGAIAIPTTNRVFFNWDGTTFVKEIAEDIAPPRRKVATSENDIDAITVPLIPLSSNIYVHNATAPLREAILHDGTLTAPEKTQTDQESKMTRTNATIEEDPN